jgi:hypothetical protein
MLDIRAYSLLLNAANLRKLEPFRLSASGYGKASHEQIGWYQTVVKAIACTVSKAIIHL